MATPGVGILEQEPARDPDAPIKARVVEALARGPNIQAEIDTATGKIVIKPRHIIEAGTVRPEEEQLGGEEVKDIAKIIKETLSVGESHDLGSLRRGLGSEKIYFWGRDKLRHMPVFRNLTGFEDNGNPVWHGTSGYSYENDAARKGLPRPASEIIILTVAEWFRKELNGATAQEAEGFYDRTEGVRKAALEKEIQLAEDEKVPGAKNQIQEAETDNQTKTAALQEAERKAGPYREAQQTLSGFIRRACGNIDKSRQGDFLQKLPPAVSVLKETGLFFNKKVVIPSDPFADFDQIAAGLIDTNPVQEAMQKLGTENLYALMVDAMKKRVQALAKIDETVESIFSKAGNILKDLHCDGAFTQAFSQQEKYILELQKGDPQGAITFAREFIARAALLKLVLRGAEKPQSGSSSFGNWLVGLHADFFYTLPHALYKSDKAVEARDQLNKVVSEKESSDQVLRDAKETLAVMEKNRGHAEEQLKKMEEKKPKMIESSQKDMLAKLLVDIYGRELTKSEIETLNIESIAKYLESQLFVDTITAIFKGLPHFIANNSRHPRAAASIYADMRAWGNPGITEKEIASLPDFLPDIVSAVLPPDHPSKEPAAQIVSDIWRRYTKHPGVGGYSGYSRELIEAPYQQGYYAPQFLELVAEGGKIDIVPNTIRRADHEKMAQLNKEGKTGELRAVWQETFDSLAKLLRSLPYHHFMMVANDRIMHPEERGFGRSPVITTDDLNSWIRQGVVVNALRELSFISNVADQTVYIFEKKQA